MAMGIGQAIHQGHLSTRPRQLNRQTGTGRSRANDQNGHEPSASGLEGLDRSGGWQITRGVAEALKDAFSHLGRSEAESFLALLRRGVVNQLVGDADAQHRHVDVLIDQRLQNRCTKTTR